MSLGETRLRPSITSAITVCLGLASIVVAPLLGPSWCVGRSCCVAQVVQDEPNDFGCHGCASFKANFLEGCLQVCRHSEVA